VAAASAAPRRCHEQVPDCPAPPSGGVRCGAGYGGRDSAPPAPRPAAAPVVKPVRRSRKRILARVRAALGDVPRGQEPGEVAVPRGRAAADGLVDLFVDRLEHYRARPHRVRAADLPEAVAAALRRRGAERAAVPADLPGAWTERTGTGLVVDAGLDLAVLDAVDGVVTGCAVAVAETGTIVLDGGRPRGGGR